MGVRHLPGQLSTTEIYTQVSIRKLKEVHALTHPADRPRAPHQPEDDHGGDEDTLFTALAAEADDELSDATE